MGLSGINGLDSARGFGYKFDQSTKPNSAKVQKGDVWRKRNSSGNVVGEFVWSGTKWEIIPAPGIFSFNLLSERPTNLTADDAGRNYLFTKTGNVHEWTGTEWIVLNKTDVNAADYLTQTEAKAAAANTHENRVANNRYIKVPVTSFPTTLQKVQNPNVIFTNETTGQAYNSKAQEQVRFFGQETLEKYFRLFKEANNNNNTGRSTAIKILLTGDSTTVLSQYKLERSAHLRGYERINLINQGHGSKAAFDWVSTYLADDIAANPDLMIIRWGANDAYYGKTPEEAISKVKEGLTILRAAKPIKDLSIVLASPGPMNDTQYNRDEYYFELLSEGYRQLAKEFGCAFVDLYSYFQDAHNGAGLYYDALLDNRAIHAEDILYEHIHSAIADMIFPLGFETGRNNAIRNYSTWDSPNYRKTEELPDKYHCGVEFRRFNDQTNAAIDGSLISFKQADGFTFQLLHSIPGYTQGNNAIAFRLGASNSFTSWMKTTYENISSFSNSWKDTSSVATSFKKSTITLGISGEVGIYLNIIAGQASVGTEILILPEIFRPKNRVVLTGIAEKADGTASGRIRLDLFSDGAVQIFPLSGYTLTTGDYVYVSAVYNIN